MDETRGDAAPLVIRGPGELIAAIPYMLGYHPAHSLVAVGVGGPGGACAVRHGLELADGVAAHIAGLLSVHGFGGALLVGYGEAAVADPAVASARRALARVGLEVWDALRVHDGRYWSYLRPAEAGVPLTPTTLEVQAVVNGMVALPSREDLAAFVAPLPDPVASAVARETALAERQRFDRAAGLRLVREVVAGVGSGRPPPGLAEIARFTVALSRVRLRDEAWVRISPNALPEHRDFWLHVVRRTAPAYRPAPACLLAYCALVTGDGALANVALDLAEREDPHYSMAALLRRALTSGIHPSAALVRMTPEDLAAAYEEPPDP
ncbi:DUF4192 domain-containing protein [Actinocorallia sp. API 0066]|uniref:DUF4192 domain-containing protein n=1 Tax=Actinocorallia sp. API 0066 TaxID=2896846 RepID=UPI001E3D4EEB|nr:DUF4192 domain-containing protein [Actinocorallia sp. API 0066]MCD0451802.1 DUF4192 domain-containing protein [Actinocorallia sp. API 0066]